MTDYIDLYTLSDLERKIIKHIDDWAHIKNVPISKKNILKEMLRKKEQEKDIVDALEKLLRKRYIRVAITLLGQKQHSGLSYVLLRRI